ncbi:CLUMA_CG004346, isoform A [Clunio marinus]|uniref:CLUMA_CG004346, isoform A n=1 Tax=Clunio marinus TaxID=568069 RepID=A0A1J1HRJ6_9DIPT|nr:CLUMA_CG004346, isoform A [Clunio marinus]
MIKIVALNDFSKDEVKEEDETITQVTKEAQETIAVSEYMRALSLKQNGKSDFALNLFQDLLRTQVLCDIPDNDKENKLFSVKYNCFRNIGLIYEERKEYLEALRHLVQAVELDDTDVYTQCKIGRISLKLNNLLLAKLAFEKCLERNPHHCGAKDGLLETLCLMEDIDQAYGYALKFFEDDRKYERAIRVLKEIRSRFKLSLEYYDGIYGRKPEFDENCQIKYDPASSVFPPPVEIGFTKENNATLTDDFKIPENNLNWITIGKLILRVFHHIEENNFSLTSCFKWDDWVGKAPEFILPPTPDAQIETNEVVNGIELNGDGEKIEENVVAVNGRSEKITEDDVESTDNENQETESRKAVNRRRCSDLDFLKEWGWHKNRRSARKKPKEDEETVDTTINGFLKRILASYFVESFESNRSPFAIANIDIKPIEDHKVSHTKADIEDEEKFYELTREAFNNFIEEIKNREFDLIHNNNYKDALGYLYKLEEVYDVPQYSEISVELKNCKNNNLIDSKTVKELIVKIERKINLASVKKLYDTKNYAELTEILRESVIYSTEPKVNIDNLTLKIQTQIEVFLECLWSLNRIEECLIYAEKGLKYAFDNFQTAPTEYRLEEWASLVNYCLVYIDAAIKDEDGSEILFALGNNLSRLVQTITQIITHQLDSPIEKNNPTCHLINLNIPWTILYHLVVKENDIANAASRKKTEDGNEEEFESPLPNSMLMFFKAHEYLGRKQWCMKDNGQLLFCFLDILTPIYRTPLLEPFRDIVTEHLEQATYCLYGYPVKKAKLRHIEEHDAKQIDLTWERAIQLFDLYRPDSLPEFDSYKGASITSEMEQLLTKILSLIPKCLDIAPFTGEIKKFINGTITNLPKEINILPSKITSIYYLLADYYFKNQETGRAIKFYINDLTMKPDRFDSWASLSLCKQSKLEMKLNSNASITVKDFLEIADQTINCFNQCLKLKKTITILTEFASFTYHLHSFCSRNLKQSSETLSMENFSAIEERKDKFLNISLKCFMEVCEAVSDVNHELNVNKTQEDSEDNHDERYYYHFMLGKIAEKKKEPPLNYLNHYLKSAKFLYEDNATYPIKINHSNPTHLAIESLEVFYRISACIMKYLEQHSKINKPTAKLFMRVLKEMSSSPFAYNRAKINKGNITAMKHKLNVSGVDKLNTSASGGESSIPTKQIKLESETSTINDENVAVVDNNKPDDVDPQQPQQMEIEEPPIQPVVRNIINNESEFASRRGSQESAVTTTTTTSTRTSSSSDSSADSSSDSSSSSSDETDGTDKENTFVSQEQINTIYKMCIKNLEECVSRFPEHYKSIYRLVHHFLNAGNSLEKCKQLLLSSNYKTTLGNPIGGLFSERKNNNFFNGIWRIPSQEIDRPGNFTTHLSKCVVVLMDVLKKTNDAETLIDLAFQLQRNPEADKKYLNDADKKELFHQAVTCCVQAFKNKLREIMAGCGDEKNRELLSLMLDIFKAHRKTQKVFQQKDQSLFSGVLVDVYKEYVKDKMVLPENANLTDLAFKISSTLPPSMVAVTSRVTPPTTPQNISKTSSSSSARTKPRSSSSVKNSSSTAANSLLNNNAAMNSMLMSLYTNPALLAQLTSSPLMSTADSSNYLNEYYKSLLAVNSTNSLNNLTTHQQLAMMNDPMTALMSGLYSPLAGQSPSTSPSTSKSTTPTTTNHNEKKYLEALKSIGSSGSSLMGLQQNGMSNSLSITKTPTSSPKSSINKSQSTSSLKKSSSMSSASLTKSNDANSSYNALFGTNLKLPALPKSLSITPSMPVSNVKSSRVSDKGKSSSKEKSTSRLNQSQSMIVGSDQSAASNMQAYYDFLKNYPNQQQTQGAKTKSSPITVTSINSAVSNSLMKSQKHKQSTQLSGQSQSKKSHTQQSSSSSSSSSLLSKAAQPYDFDDDVIILD